MPDLPRLLFARAQLIGMGRCADCGWHVPTQSHHEACPTRAGEDP